MNIEIRVIDDGSILFIEHLSKSQ